MDTLVLIIEIVLCLFSLFMVAVVLLQSGKSAGLSGDIAGGAATFLGKSKAKSYEGTLKKLTKIAAVGIMALAVVLVLVQVYGMPADEGTVESDTTTVEASPTPVPLVVPDTQSEVDSGDTGATTEDTNQ